MALSKLHEEFRRDFDDTKSSNIDVFARYSIELLQAQRSSQRLGDLADPPPHIRFGSLIFQNPASTQNGPNYLNSPINGNFSISDFQKQYDWQNERQSFFSWQVPYQNLKPGVEQY